MTYESRAKDGRFLTGNTAATGRPRGSRAKLSEAFLSALCEDFCQHGAATIHRVRIEKPDAYLKVVASILPKQIEVTADPFDGMSDDELEALVAAAAAALRSQQDNEPDDEKMH
jgi:TATA-binding protein-associated factor Taf7